jgi:hypothetical protein
MLASVMIGVVSANFLARLHFLHLHSGGGNIDNLAVVHFGKDIDFVRSRKDLVLAILFDSLAEKVFAIKESRKIK